MGLSADDRLEILELAARYNHAIDSGKADAWAATFTDDGIFDTPQQTFTGADQLKQFASGFLDMFKQPRHWTANSVIEGDGETASHTAYVHLMSVEGGVSSLLSGIYQDQLKKVDGAWKFTVRKFTMDG